MLCIDRGGSRPFVVAQGSRAALLRAHRTDVERSGAHDPAPVPHLWNAVERGIYHRRCSLVFQPKK